MTEDATTGKILDAAMDLFMENGLRGTSMEAIAKAASVAKPTLYARFKNKDEVFVEGAQRVIMQLQNIVDQNLAEEGSVTERVAGGIIGKYEALDALLRNSPHATELIVAPKHLASDAFAKFECHLRESIAAVIAETAPDEAARLASIVIASADGINRLGSDKKAVASDIRLMVTRVLSA